MNSKSILVVEDNPNWRDLLKVLLRPDYEIEDVGSVQDAEDKLKSRRFGLVITNLQLGPFVGIADQLGLTVIEKLQEYAPGTPCIILTGSDHEKQKQVQAFCNMRYGGRVWVVGKGIENLYKELRNRISNSFVAVN
jgi:DNA-binding NtrC family response regulator